MTIRTIESRSDLDRLVAGGGAILIEVVEPGDAASQAFAGTVDAVLAPLSQISRARIDLAGAADVAALFGIDRAPGMVLFRNGVGLFAGPAEFGNAQLEALLRRALSLDMDAVRRDMDRDREALASSASFRACPTSKRGEFPPA